YVLLPSSHGLPNAMDRGVLNGKSLVIICGTTGIGLSAARAFVKEGARVIIVGRNSEYATAAQKSLGKSSFPLAADATDSNTASSAIALALEKFGAFHGLYHVAGGSGRSMGDGPLHELTDVGWHATIDLNLTSLIYSNRAVVH